MKRSPRLAFVMDQQVGLKTQALNFQYALRNGAAIEARFVPVHYAAPHPNPFVAAAEKLLPASVRGTLAGMREIRAAFKNVSYDGVLWATWAAKSVPDCVRTAPAFLVMDMTPVQMEALGEQYGYTADRARFLGGWKRRATDVLYREATHFFPWNDWVAQSLLSDYAVPAEKITVLSPGTDTERFFPDETAKPNDGITRLLFVGGDFLRKGGDLLLRYVRERGARLPPIELHCITRDPIADAPANVVFHHGIVNNSPELVRLYQTCDLFVLPTRADCYSLVALEAMASGLPVIITGIGGIPGIVSPETGILLPEGDNYAELCAALDDLIGDAAKREVMGRAARDRAVADFNFQTTVFTIVKKMRLEASARSENVSPPTEVPLQW